MNINLKQLEAFVWVTDLGSFRLAAERLHTTQPNVSVRISTLETALGLKLLNRDGGKVSLTADGKPLLEHARAVLRSMEKLQQAAGKESLIDGVLRLGVTELVAHTWLREFLQQMKQQYPKINTELTVDVSATLEKELTDRTIDLALLSVPAGTETTGQVSLGTYPLIWVCAKKLNLHKLPQPTAADLAEFTLLTHSRDTIPFAEISEHFSKHADQVRITPSNSLSACLHMAIDGLGVSALPSAMLRDELANGELVQINYHWLPGSLNFVARHEEERSTHLVSQAAKLAGDIASSWN